MIDNSENTFACVHWCFVVCVCVDNALCVCVCVWTMFCGVCVCRMDVELGNRVPLWISMSRKRKQRVSVCVVDPLFAIGFIHTYRGG